MTVKINLRATPALAVPTFRLNPDTREALLLLIHLLKPTSLAFFLLAAWRFVADLNWLTEFPISDGLLNHWQLWAAFGLATLSIEGFLVRRVAPLLIRIR
jgi:hypothetical protein